MSIITTFYRNLVQFERETHREAAKAFVSAEGKFKLEKHLRDPHITVAARNKQNATMEVLGVIVGTDLDLRGEEMRFE